MTLATRAREFNTMYGLPTPARPVMGNPQEFIKRMGIFRKMLEDEVSELDEIVAKAADGSPEAEVLTDLADWLGDIQVYCMTEMIRFGLPGDLVLNAIMDSNASKLGADGQPIVVGDKVIKGPGYWKPEPRIRAALEHLMAGGHEA